MQFFSNEISTTFAGLTMNYMGHQVKHFTNINAYTKFSTSALLSGKQVTITIMVKWEQRSVKKTAIDQ